MANINDSPQSMDEAIRAAFRQRTRQILAEEAEKAANEVKRRIALEADSLVLKLLRHYEVASYVDRIVIEVKKVAS
jgi:hypothetical protein